MPIGRGVAHTSQNDVCATRAVIDALRRLLKKAMVLFWACHRVKLPKRLGQLFVRCFKGTNRAAFCTSHSRARRWLPLCANAANSISTANAAPHFRRIATPVCLIRHMELRWQSKSLFLKNRKNNLTEPFNRTRRVAQTSSCEVCEPPAMTVPCSLRKSPHTCQNTACTRHPAAAIASWHRVSGAAAGLFWVLLAHAHLPTLPLICIWRQEYHPAGKLLHTRSRTRGKPAHIGENDAGLRHD